MKMLEATDIIDWIYEQTNKIMEAINKDDHVMMLNETDLLLKVMGQEFMNAHKFGKIYAKIKEILNDEPSMRVLKLMQRVKTEVDTSIEYYDKDRGQDERLFYQTPIEEQMIHTQEDIRKVLSTIIREKTGSGIEV
jgi:hypothetical protein